MSTAKKSSCDIADPSLAKIGVSRIEWAARELPVIGQIRERFAAQRPLAGISIGKGSVLRLTVYRWEMSTQSLEC